MKRSVTIETRRDDGAEESRWLIMPRPFDHWGQRFCSVDVDGVRGFRELAAGNSNCRGYLCEVDPAAEVVSVRYTVDLLEQDDADWAAPGWVWRLQDNRYTTPSPDLANLAQEVTDGAASQRDALRRIVDQAAGIFGYGHVEDRFNDGHDAVPTVCGTTRGSCVDINTYLLAAARSVGIRGQYVAGYWFHPDKTETPDMHCWLVFEPDGTLVFWDLAHAIKWANALGARVEEGLNPAGGRRIAMSCGRGLSFETPLGPVSISHFSEPFWVTPGPEGADAARAERGRMIIRVEDPGGLRTQFPADFTKEEAAA